MKNEKANAGEKINDFFRKNRKGIFTSVCLVLFLIVAFVAFLAVNEHTQKKAINEVEQLNGRYAEISDINDEQETVAVLLDDLYKFAKNKRGFAGSRAWTIIARIYSERNEWQQAQEAWLNAAKAGEKTYLAPIAFFNAAAAAEEQGKPEQAIELLQNSLSCSFEFPAAPRAQFSIGRLNEKLENYPAALEAYRAVLIKWPQMPVWQNLARSRIAAIEIM